MTLDLENQPISRYMKDQSKGPFWRRLLDSIFGYDFFVSYTWSDGRAYAEALTRRMEQERFTVFLDRTKYSPGEDWKRVGAWTLYNTSQLIVVGSPAAPKSNPVIREVEIFSKYGHRIIPIAFEDSLVFEKPDSPLAQLIPSEILRV